MKKPIVLITAGGTVEPIDGVRGITNFSSGKLGALIAERLFNCEVILIKGRKSAMPECNLKNITIIEVTDTQSVQDAIERVMNSQRVDYFIHSMAISDYTVDKISSIDDIVSQIRALDNPSAEDAIDVLRFPAGVTNRNKVSSTIEHPILYLKQTPKIIATIKTRWPFVKLIAFKLLNKVDRSELIRVATESAIKVDADYIVANDLQYINGAQHKAFFMSRCGTLKETNTKPELADVIYRMIYDEANQ